ncbi:hypothetical protein [Arthrobacter alkaliphilus]|uniref:hypothetical protein n=1 Tax=Arthrobacter alkaliphilus TaxID=369936 RepID=UPI001F31BDDB|nr:hypothetical protein [Arthrobacter alkaliphilus]
MDGQQWIWVVMVLVGAALVAAVMVFGRQRLKLFDRKRTAKRDAGKLGGSRDDIANPDDAPGPGSPNQ